MIHSVSIFNKKAHSSLHYIQQASLILLIGTLLGNFLSFVKSPIMANYFGTSGELDAYFLSLAPLNLISGILLSATQAVMIPRYLKLRRQETPDYAFAFFLIYAFWILGGGALASLGLWFANSWIASLLGKGFDASRTALTAKLLQMSSVLLLLRMLNDIGGYLFHAHERFALPALLPLVGGTFSLVYIVLFHEQGVVSLLHGLILGLCLQVGFMVYRARSLLPGHILILHPVSPDILKTLFGMMPLLLGASFGQVNVVIDQIMTSTLSPGSISALNYASRLHMVSTQMFIMVVSQAVLPYFSRQTAENDFETLRETFFLTLRRMLLILLPVSLAIILFGKFAVQIVFQRGAFTAESTAATSQAWIAYSIGLPMQAIGILTARMFNALQENTTLMYVSGISIGLNILFNSILMKFWGHVGIAASTSMLYCVTTCVLLYALHAKIGLFRRNHHAS